MSVDEKNINDFNQLRMRLTLLPTLGTFTGSESKRFALLLHTTPSHKELVPGNRDIPHRVVSALNALQ